MSDSKRDQTVDVLRSLGILLMISGHIGLGEGRAEYIFSTWYHSFHMPLFFLLSGYFFTDVRPQWVQFAGRKARSLLLPYLLWALFHVAYNAVRFQVPFSFQGNLVQSFLHPTQKLFPIAGALWFLPALFWANLLYDLIFRMISGRSLRLGVSLAFCFAGMILCKKQIYLPLGLDAAITAIGFMAFGTLFKEGPKYIGNSKNKEISKCAENKTCADRLDLFHLKPFVLLILWPVFLILVFLNGPVNFRTGDYPGVILTFLNAVLGTLLMWNLAGFVVCMLPRKINTVLAHIGQDSILFLCINQLLIKELMPYAASWTGNSLLGRLCLNASLTIMIVVIGLLLLFLFNRSRLLRCFLGR